MGEHTYKVIEIVGTSQESIEDAVQRALTRAGKTIHHLRWFKILETRGQIENDNVAHWQVTLKVGFTLEDSK